MNMGAGVQDLGTARCMNASNSSPHFGLRSSLRHTCSGWCISQAYQGWSGP